MYEYACRDDNYDMVNLLIGARSREATEKRQIWTETPDGTRRMGG